MTEQMDPQSDEATVWQGVKQLLGSERIALGYHWSYNLRQDPKRLGFVLSRYKFAAKMACTGAHVLELGCSEGIGTPILAEFARSYTGVDMDARAIGEASANWGSESCRFAHADFMGRAFDCPPAGSQHGFGAIVSMDVVEHIYPEYDALFWETVHTNLDPGGIAVIGTPNITSEPYASAASRQGHVNLYGAERLKAAMDSICHTSFLFGINDEMVHTGYHAMCHFLVAVGCYRRERIEAAP
ncbi:MAG: class I SAM-dependent methyltransferase [Candidatus Sericytochromatia bacterium]